MTTQRLKRLQARENESYRVAIGFSFASDWSRKWREFSRPIAKRGKGKTIQSRITFYAQFKIALSSNIPGGALPYIGYIGMCRCEG